MPPSHPFVDCIIPTHGRPDALARALRSVAGQTNFVRSVTVVDDLGSVESEEVVQTFTAVLDVRYVDASAADKKGAAASRNLGARSGSTGTVLAFLDDDDFWEPTFLEALVTRLGRGDVGLVASWGSLEHEGGRVPHCWHAEEGLTAEDVFSHNPGITGTNFVIRRADFDRTGGFDADQWVFNDLEFFVRFLDKGGRYAVVRQDLAVQTVSRGGHLSSRSDRRAEGILRYIRLHDSRLTPTQRRTLKRQAAVARLHPTQAPVKRLRFLLQAIALSGYADLVQTLHARFVQGPKY